MSSDPNKESRQTGVVPIPDRPFLLEHFFVILVTLGVLALLGLFTARPAYREIKRWRALWLVSDVPTLLAGGAEDLREAGSHVRAALSLAPQEPRVLRATAQYCKQVGVAQELNYWQLLIGTGKATHDDQLEAVEVAIVEGQLDFAAAELEKVLAAEPQNLRGLRLRTQLLARRGRIPAAIVSARAALKASPQDADLELTLARLQMRSSNPAQRAEANGRILNLATNAGLRQDAALALVAGHGRMTRAEAEAVLRVLEGRTNHPVLAHLQAASIQLALNPDEKSSIFRGVFARHLMSTNEVIQGEVADWAMQEGGAAELLAVLPRDSGEMNGVMLSIRLEAAASLGRWDEFDRMAAVVSGNALLVQVHALNAVRLAQTQNPAAATDQLAEALKGCGKNPRALTLVAVTAERIGLTNAALAAWQRQLGHPIRGLTAARQMVRLSASLDDFRPAREALERIHQLNPDNHGVARRLAYLNLLLDVHVPEAQAIFHELEGDAAEAAVVRLGLAFAQWRSGDATGALATAEREAVDFDALPQNWRALYVALLGAANRRAAARDFARKVDTNALRRDERALIEPWL